MPASTQLDAETEQVPMEVVPVPDANEAMIATQSQAPNRWMGESDSDSEPEGETLESEDTTTVATSSLEETWSNSPLSSISDIQSALVEFFEGTKGQRILNNVSYDKL